MDVSGLFNLVADSTASTSNFNTLKTAIATKPDTIDVNTSLGLKADSSTVLSTFDTNLKANTTDVNTSLGLKTDSSIVPINYNTLQQEQPKPIQQMLIQH